ncbi:MAG: hypothetical protein IPO92_00785 [Saprospiraceae bacterium]|nr:hypothetical protein [Saprospiraceae bacterium]
MSAKPCVFARTYESNTIADKVVCAINIPSGKKIITVIPYFKEGDQVSDAYSNTLAIVKNGVVELNTPYDIVLLEHNNK